MRFKEINYLQFEEYVTSAWDGDLDLEMYYDPNLSNRSLRGMVFDTIKKIKDHYYYNEELKIYGIDENFKPIGFVVLGETKGMIYSFGINKNMRTPEKLKSLFEFMRINLNNKFFMYLYDKNERAINWLKRCGMKHIKGLEPIEGVVYMSY